MGCLRGTFLVLTVLRSLDFLHISPETVSYPDGSGRKFEDMRSRQLHFLYTGKEAPNICGYPEIFSLPRALENSRKYFA